MTRWEDADLDGKFKEEACVHCVLFDRTRELICKTIKLEVIIHDQGEEIRELQILVQDMEHRLREAGL